MSRGSGRRLSEAELRDLYQYVESGYRHVNRGNRLRGLAGRVGRALGVQAIPAGPVEDSTVHHYDSPVDAVFMNVPGLFTVPVAWFRNHVLFGHGSGGFNAWEATARQLVADPDIDHRDTVLARFYREFRPSSFAELLFADPEEDVPRTSRLWEIAPREYMNVYPWSASLHPWPARLPEHLRLTEYGPASDEIVQLEVWRLRRLVVSISREGYRPLGASGTRGYFVMAGSKARFVVRSGFHRSVTLAALGHTDLPVLFTATAPRLVTLDSLAHWPMVKSGLFDPALAEKLARRFVSDNGGALATRLGFEPHP